jgi:hypothetical protein
MEVEMSYFSRGSATRSNLYSGSKFTNWTRFDPYDSEIGALPCRVRPRLVIRAGETRVSVFVRPLNERFVRPFDAEAVRDVIEQVPAEFVVGLSGIILLGGTRKQDKVCYSLFHYGCYGGNRIYLHPYPRRRMVRWLGTRADPWFVQEFGPHGAEFVEDRGSRKMVWSEDSLRRYYLHNVLLHELGHHVDKRDANRRKSERFAEWFAAEQARSLQA